MHLRTCRMCGKTFDSVSSWRGICDDCRKIRRKECLKRYRAARIYELDFNAYAVKQESLDVRIEKARKKKLNAERTDIDCPNYDPTRVDCAVCASDSWRYKGCGAKK